MNRVQRKLEIIRRMGIRWTAYRAWYTIKKGSGLLRLLTPATRLRTDRGGNAADVTPDSIRAFLESQLGHFFFPLGEPPDGPLLRGIAGDEGVGRTIRVADDFCQGRFLYYSRKIVDHGRPVDWLRLGPTGPSHHANVHWSKYPTFSAELGDVKTVWEPSRFACAFWLARAFIFTGDEKYPAAFWNLFESWVRQNPPNRGPNWKCGQEASFRAFAWLFALHVFWRSPATTADRITTLLEMLVLTARRVSANIGYAISQKNNHGISEAAGLLTLGLMLPFIRESASWRAKGRRLLEREMARQVYDDGSYVQHSMNYHRVMLHDALWIMPLARRNAAPLSTDFQDRVKRAAEFLIQMQDDGGRVPNYGNNDGALVLPLDACDYTDFRPVVQSAGFATTGRRVYPPGPWDECGVWLFGDSFRASLHSPPQRSSRRFDAGGYFTIRTARAWAMVRCHTYRDRPAQVDLMHVDLWHDGVNVLGDSGTYLYFAPGEPRFERFFKEIASHNTVEIGGRGPLEAASRFMWIPWPCARCVEHGPARFIGESDAYDREPWHVRHRRIVEASNENEWTITDDLLGAGHAAAALRWHLADGPFVWQADQHWLEAEWPQGKMRMTFDLPPGMRMSVHRGEEGDLVQGWESLYYGERTPRPTIVLGGRVALPARIITRVSLGSRTAP